MNRSAIRVGDASNRCGILAAGNFVIDHVAMIDHYPDQDALANILASSVSNGGPAYNALVDWARLDMDCPLEGAGLVGRDADGDRVLHHLADLGVRHTRVARHDDAVTSYSNIMTTTGSGRRTIFHHRGANALFGPEHIDLDNSTAKVFFLAFLGLLDRMDQEAPQYGTVAAKVLAHARSLGMITAADVVTDSSGRLPGLVQCALPHLDFLFCNEIEAEMISGIGVRGSGVPAGILDSAALEDAGRAMLSTQRSGTAWVVIHAAEGAMAVHATDCTVWQGSVLMPVDRIVGSNGAGDAFAAGFLAGVHDARPVSECLRLAVCVAASSLADSTPSAGILPLPACLRLGDEYGFTGSEGQDLNRTHA